MRSPLTWRPRRRRPPAERTRLVAGPAGRLTVGDPVACAPGAVGLTRLLEAAAVACAAAARRVGRAHVDAGSAGGRPRALRAARRGRPRVAAGGVGDAAAEAAVLRRDRARAVGVPAHG